MKETLRIIQYTLLICFVFSIPFSLGEIKLNSYLIILLAINTFLLTVFSKNKTKYSFGGLLILFVSVYLVHFWGLVKTDNYHEAVFELQKKLSILLFPLVLFFSPRFTAKEVRTVMLVFALSCLLTSIVCLAAATYRFFILKDVSVFFYHELSSIADMHATYLSMYMCFSIAILILIYSDETHAFSARDEVLFCFSVILLGLMVVLLGARTQLFVLIIGVIAYSAFFFYKRKKLIKSILGALVAGVVLVGLVLFFPTNRERFKQAINYKGQYALNKGWGDQQVRYLIWSGAFELIKTEPLTGVGTGDVQDELQKIYTDNGYNSLTYLQNTRYNAHNQFLETAIGLGIPGLMVLLASFFFSLQYALKHKKILYFIFILLFVVSCMTESLLERQSGIVFYAFFNSFLFLNSMNKPGNISISTA